MIDIKQPESLEYTINLGRQVPGEFHGTFSLRKKGSQNKEEGHEDQKENRKLDGRKKSLYGFFCVCHWMQSLSRTVFISIFNELKIG